MKTWQIIALVGAAGLVLWFLMRKSAGLPAVPGLTGGSSSGPPSSVASLINAPTNPAAGTATQSSLTKLFSSAKPGTFLSTLFAAGTDIYNGANSGALTPDQVIALQNELLAFNAANGGVAPSTGPATEALSGRGHF